LMLLMKPPTAQGGSALSFPHLALPKWAIDFPHCAKVFHSFMSPELKPF
jgi:hypothetical protein